MLEGCVERLVRRLDDRHRGAAVDRREHPLRERDRGLDLVEVAGVDRYALAAQARVGEADLDQLDAGALERGLGGARRSRGGVGLEDRQGARLRWPAYPGHRLEQADVHVGQQEVVDHRAAARLEAGGERLLDRRGRAADQGQPAAAGDRAAAQHRDRRLLDHRVGGAHGGRDVGELDERERGVGLHLVT